MTTARTRKNRVAVRRSPAPKFGASLDSVEAARTPRALPALPAAIRTRADALFADADDVGETRALLVLRDGELIYERYGAGFGPQTKLISWSMAKSITVKGSSTRAASAGQNRSRARIRTRKPATAKR